MLDEHEQYEMDGNSALTLTENFLQPKMARQWKTYLR